MQRCSPSFLFIVFFPFFPLSSPPLISQFSIPKSSLSGTSELLLVAQETEPAEAGCWGGVWTGLPRGKKRISFLIARTKKVRRTSHAAKGAFSTLRLATPRAPCLALGGPIRANRFADSRESLNFRDSSQGSRTEPLFANRFSGH